MRRTILILIALAAGGAIAAPPPEKPREPTRLETLSGDLAGPAVDWTGEIALTLRDDGDTCFVLRQTGNEAGHFMGHAGAFIACSPGPFDPVQFGPGRELRVKGNLGAAMTRRIGDAVFNYPLVAGAFVELLPPREPLYWPPDYYDPFYPPYYPYYGPYRHPRPWPPYYRRWR